ncbi:MAG: ECF-type sigma factor [Pseudomonadota bacterium]
MSIASRPCINMPHSDITDLLRDVGAGDEEALDLLAARLYPELKSLARRRSASHRGMGASTLVNEMFVRLLSNNQIASDSRQQFFGLASTIMRRVIVDEVRYLAAEKRLAQSDTLAESMISDPSSDNYVFLIDVDTSLNVLEHDEPRLVRVFECRYFAGLTTAETADCLGLSQRSVERDWARVRAELSRLLDQGDQTAQE